MKKVVEVPEKLGWRPEADLAGLLPLGMKTRYQREIGRLIAVELLEWPWGNGAGAVVPHGLTEILKRDRSVAPLHTFGLSTGVSLTDVPGITRVICICMCGSTSNQP